MCLGVLPGWEGTGRASAQAVIKRLPIGMDGKVHPFDALDQRNCHARAQAFPCKTQLARRIYRENKTLDGAVLFCGCQAGMGRQRRADWSGCRVAQGDPSSCSSTSSAGRSPSLTAMERLSALSTISNSPCSSAVTRKRAFSMTGLESGSIRLVSPFPGVI